MDEIKSRINSTNVDHLQLSWYYPTHSFVTGKPLVAYNRVYAYDWMGYIYFLDLHTGKEIYKRQLYTPTFPAKGLNKIPGIQKHFGQHPPYLQNGFAGSGCLSDGYLYLASVGSKPGKTFENGESGEFFIIDPIGGNTIFREKLSLTPYAGSLSTLLADKHHIYVGISSCEETVELISKRLLRTYQPTSVGQVIAYDKTSGKRKWTQRTIGLLPYDSIYAKGASVCGGFAFDPRYHTLFFGTGLNHGSLISKSSNSLIALDANTGNLKWHYQLDLDSSFNATPNLFYCKYQNALVPAVGIGSKNGHYYVFHRLTGNLIWQTDCHINTDTDNGIHSIASYKDNCIYIWSKNKNPSNTITVCCLNAHTGEIIWSKIIKGTNTLSSGSLINDLYFIPTYDGRINAYNLADGRIVWTGKIPDVSIGSSISFTSNSLLVGAGVPALYNGNPNTCGVYSFKLS